MICLFFTLTGFQACSPVTHYSVEMQKKDGDPQDRRGPTRQGSSELGDVTRAPCCFCEVRASFQAVLTLVLSSAQEATQEGNRQDFASGATLRPHTGLFSAFKHGG